MIIQDALQQVDIVRPTVTATDQGENSVLVEMAELLLNTTKLIVHRTLYSEHVEADVEMLFTISGGKDAFQAKPKI